MYHLDRKINTEKGLTQKKSLKTEGLIGPDVVTKGWKKSNNGKDSSETLREGAYMVYKRIHDIHIDTKSVFLSY